MENQFNYNALNPMSFELGITSILNKFIVGFQIDPLKWEGNFNFGVRF